MKKPCEHKWQIAEVIDQNVLDINKELIVLICKKCDAIKIKSEEE